MGNTVKSYQDLVVWQKAVKLCTYIYKLSSDFPESEKFGITNQIRRAAVSVSSNIAEGWGRNSTKNYTQFLKIGRGSLLETQSLLIVSKELHFITIEEYEQLNSLIEEISKMLNRLISTLENKNIIQNEPTP